MNYIGQARRKLDKYTDSPVSGVMFFKGAKVIGQDGNKTAITPFDGDGVFFVDTQNPIVTQIDDTEYEASVFENA